MDIGDLKLSACIGRHMLGQFDNISQAFLPSEYPHLNIGGVYAICDLLLGDAYIGSSINVMKRLSDHRSRLRNGTHNNRRLQAAWTESGAGNFQFLLLEQVDDWSHLHVVEQRWIDDIRPGFNIASCVASTFLGLKHTPETRAKMAARKIGIKRTPLGPFAPAHRKALSDAAKQRCLRQGKKLRVRAAPTRRRERPVEILGIVYKSVLEAANGIGLCPKSVRNRIKRGGARYLDVADMASS